MPIIQPCKDAAPNYFKNFFEKIRVEFGKLDELDDDNFVNLIEGWFSAKNFPQTESCNFTSSLFPNSSMDVETLTDHIYTLGHAIKRIERLNPSDTTVDSEVMKYSKQLLELALNDYRMWLEVRNNRFEEAIKQLTELEETSKEILPYRSEIYSLMKREITKSLMQQNLQKLSRVSRGEDYKTKFANWMRSFPNHISQTETSKEIASYFTSDEYLNLEKLVSDEKYFLEKINILLGYKDSSDSEDSSDSKDSTLLEMAKSDELIGVINKFSQDQLLKNIERLHLIIDQLNSMLKQIEDLDRLHLSDLLNRIDPSDRLDLLNRIDRFDLLNRLNRIDRLDRIKPSDLLDLLDLLNPSDLLDLLDLLDRLNLPKFSSKDIIRLRDIFDNLLYHHQVRCCFTIDECLNLGKLTSRKYFLHKMGQLSKYNALVTLEERLAKGDELLREINTFSQEQLSENIERLQRILRIINHPRLTGLYADDILHLHSVFTKLLRYHQSLLADDPKEREILFQDVYNSFFEEENFETLWCDFDEDHPDSKKISFEMLNKNDSYLLLALKYFSKEYTRRCLIDEEYNTGAVKGIYRIDTLFAPRSYDQKTFTHRIDVLNNLIGKIDTFEEITPESKDYLKKLFNLFLLEHQAIMHLNEKEPEEAIKCLNELKEKSKGIFLRYSEEYRFGTINKLMETCKSQISEEGSIIPTVQPYQTESLESLDSLDNDALVNLINKWFSQKDLPQTRSDNFDSLLFADASMDVDTLIRRKDVLENIVKKVNSLSTNPTVDPMVIEYSKKLLELAVEDYTVWLKIKNNNLEDAIKQLISLEKKSKGILPYRSKIYSSMGREVMESSMRRKVMESSMIREIVESSSVQQNPQEPVCVSRGEDYKMKFTDWYKSFTDDLSNFEVPQEIYVYFLSDEYLNLKKLVSDEDYFLRKMHQLVSDTKEAQIARNNLSIATILGALSRKQLTENIDTLHRILDKINDPNLTEFSPNDILCLNSIFTKFLYHHQLKLFTKPNKHEEEREREKREREGGAILKGMYNNFFEQENFEALWCDFNKENPNDQQINFEMLSKNSSYLLLALKYFAKTDTRRSLLDKSYNLEHITSLFAPQSSYDRKTFTHRIDVLNNLIKKIDTFGEITTEGKDYLKKLFNLFLLDHQARMCLGEKEPEKAIECLRELKEKSKGIFLHYSKGGGRVDEIIEACQSQIAKGETC